MCVPLGTRKSSRRSSSEHVCVKKITKAEVESIIAGGNYECLYQLEGSNSFVDYEGCRHNLYLILHDSTTKVKVAGSRTPGYKDGYKTVVMKAPCVSATILLRQ